MNLQQTRDRQGQPWFKTDLAAPDERRRQHEAEDTLAAETAGSAAAPEVAEPLILSAPGEQP